MRRLKVAHITTAARGLRELLLNQLINIQDAGYEVVGISSPGPSAAIVEAAGIRHIAVPMSRNMTPAADLASLSRLYRVLRSEGFDIVHTHNPKPGLLGQVAARLAGVQVVINTVHGFYFTDRTDPRLRRLYIGMEKLAATCSDVILSQNSEDIQTAINLGVCAPSKIKYLGNGIDIHRFDRAHIDGQTLQQLRNELGLPAGKPTVGFVGRLVGEKGLRELLQGANLVLKQFPDTKFLIVGSTDEEKGDALTPAVANEYGVGHACVFTGWRQDVPELYSLMDVFVLPSHREGFPRVGMEASAMGVPAILTDIRGCREVVQHDYNGLLVPLGDQQALASAIIELLTDRDRADAMGRAARLRAEELFDEQRVFAKVKSEYERLLRAKGIDLPANAPLLHRDTV